MHVSSGALGLPSSCALCVLVCEVAAEVLVARLHLFACQCASVELAVMARMKYESLLVARGRRGGRFGEGGSKNKLQRNGGWASNLCGG